MLLIVILLAYLLLLLVLGRLKGATKGNEGFFLSHRSASWPMVAFGMVGASISGVSLLSVPGQVIHSQMSYLQMCIGFIPGYFLVAFVLLPVYYRQGGASIYSYLGRNLGITSQRSAAGCFLLSKIASASVRLYALAFFLDAFVLDALGVPFWVTALILTAVIYLYTSRGGLETLITTDVVQTFCLLTCLALILAGVLRDMGLDIPQAYDRIRSSGMDQVFFFDDPLDAGNFFKQLLSGIFMVVVMTGLDQDMMQKNLSCKTLRDAQKDMCLTSLAFVPMNLLLLTVGVLLCLKDPDGLAGMQPDSLMTGFIASGSMGQVMVLLLGLSMLSSSLSSADSSAVALTTVVVTDIVRRPKDVRLRKAVHLMVMVLLFLLMMLCRHFFQGNLLDAVYTVAGYGYGPLLGMFIMALLFPGRQPRGIVPAVAAIASPLLSWAAKIFLERSFHYQTGYELLLLNALACLLLLLSFSRKAADKPQG